MPRHPDLVTGRGEVAHDAERAARRVSFVADATRSLADLLSAIDRWLRQAEPL